MLNIWDRLYVMVYMHLASTYLYMLYIFHKQIWWTREGKSVETSLGKMVHYAMPSADALKQTLKAITYVICIMQHNASALTWYAVHQQVELYHRTAPCHNNPILRQESVPPRCHLEQMHGKCDWCPRRGNLCNWITREVPLEPTNQTHPSTCTYTK